MYPEYNESNMSCGVVELDGFDEDSSAKEIHKTLVSVGQDFFNDDPQHGRYEGLWPNERYVRFNPPRRKDVADLWPDCAFLLFSHQAANRVTRRFAALIERENLGEVWRSKPAHNPNSGNNIVVYVWRVNKANFKSWYVKHRGENE